MSLNWKEINLILEELSLEGAQIQKVIQSAFDMLCIKIYGKAGLKNLLISISPGACRIHQTFYPAPKSDKPLRFAEFLAGKQVQFTPILKIKIHFKFKRMRQLRGTADFLLFIFNPGLN